MWAICGDVGDDQPDSAAPLCRAGRHGAPAFVDDGFRCHPRLPAGPISAGTEQMRVEFGRASLLAKAGAQSEKGRRVPDKDRTDGYRPPAPEVTMVYASGGRLCSDRR